MLRNTCSQLLKELLMQLTNINWMLTRLSSTYLQIHVLIFTIFTNIHVKRWKCRSNLVIEKINAMSCMNYVQNVSKKVLTISYYKNKLGHKELWWEKLQHKLKKKNAQTKYKNIFTLINQQLKNIKRDGPKYVNHSKTSK